MIFTARYEVDISTRFILLFVFKGVNLQNQVTKTATIDANNTLMHVGLYSTFIFYNSSNKFKFPLDARWI